MVPWTWLTSKHSIRSGASGRLERVLELLERLAARGEVAGPGDLVPGERLLGVAADRVHEGPLVAALRDAQVDAETAEGAQPVARPRTRRARSGRGPRAARCRARPAPVAVDLLEQVLDQLGDVLALLLDHPAALAADPAAADEEHLDGRLELVVGEGEDVRVGLVGEDDGVLLEGLAEGAEVVAEPGGQLVLHGVGRGLAHLPLDALGELGRVAGHEVAEVLGDLRGAPRG